MVDSSGSLIDTLIVPQIITGTNGDDDLYNELEEYEIRGLAGNDTIENIGAFVTIDGGAGNDSIANSAEAVQVDGGAGNDTVDNFGYAVSISGAAGKDFIYNVGFEVTIDAGADNDTIYNSADGVSINGGEGADKISLEGYQEMVSVNGGAGNDTIYGESDNEGGVAYQYENGGGKDVIVGFTEYDTLQILSGNIKSSVISGSNLTLNIGSGSVQLNDIIGKYITFVDSSGGVHESFVPVVLTKKADSYSNEVDDLMISALDGNDTLENFADFVTLSGDAGNDYLYNSGMESSLSGGAGNDTIENFVEDATLDGGAGADYLYNEGEFTLIKGGAGKDTIEHFGSGTISGGTDNDLIYNYGYQNVIQYANGDGKDTVFGFSEYDTLEITTGAIKSHSVKDMDVTLSVGSGSITLKDAAGKNIHYVDASGTAHSTVFSGVKELTKGDDEYYNESTRLVIKALAGNDTLDNYGSNVTIDGGAGRDDIYNGYSASEVSIVGGAGNDYITNIAANVEIDGGAGHDYINLSYTTSNSKYYRAENDTIRGGKGNDTINNTSGGSGNVYQYASGDGRDVITGFSAKDTIQITSGSISSTSVSGNNTILKIGSGSITLLNYTGEVKTSGVAVSGSSAMWFTEDDTNFISNDAQLSDITQSEYSVTNIETASNFDTFAQDTILAAAADSHK